MQDSPLFEAGTTMAAAVGQNATVEEILASIRQAISQDDAKRTEEHLRADLGATMDKRTSGADDSVSGSEQAMSEPLAEPMDEEPSPADHDAIEKAIEQALNGVRAELEAGVPKALQAPQSRLMREGVAAASVGGPRAVPRASRIAAIRHENINPRRALLSPSTDAHVSASFQDLTKAMMGGNPRKLDEVVEEVLRPMLKGWLEENLPQMVERLVREEIERVARGRR
jgi:cell pole-organizing protein PopZ